MKTYLLAMCIFAQFCLMVPEVVLAEAPINKNSLPELTVSNAMDFLGHLKINNPHYYSAEKDGKTSYILGTVHVGVSLDNLPQLVKEHLLNSSVVLTEVEFVKEPYANNQDFFKNFNYRRYLLDILKKNKIFVEKFKESSTPKPGTTLIFPEYNFTLEQKQALRKWGFTDDEINNLPTNATYNYIHIWPNLTLKRAPLDVEAEVLAKLNNILHKCLDCDGVRDRANLYATPTSQYAKAIQADPTYEAVKEVTESGSESSNAEKLDLEYLANYLITHYDLFLDLRQKLVDMLKMYLDGEFNKDEINDINSDHFSAYRNMSWLPIIEQHHVHKGSFIAVGATHLYGDLGLIRQLEYRGFTVKKVFK